MAHEVRRLLGTQVRGLRRGCAKRDAGMVPPTESQPCATVLGVKRVAGAIAERRSAPLMPGTGVQIVRDRVGGSMVSGSTGA